MPLKTKTHCDVKSSTKEVSLGEENKIMAEGISVKELDEVVVRFSGDSGDGMQLAGNIFSTISATVGNGISTFPDYPADIRAPQGSLTGVSGYQVNVTGDLDTALTPGDKCDVLVAMNAAALKTQIKNTKPTATIIIDTNSFEESDLKKAEFKSYDYLDELGIDRDHVVACPITNMVKEALKDSGLDNRTMLKSRNMFALGIVCWLFNRDLELGREFLRKKFKKKPSGKGGHNNNPSAVKGRNPGNADRSGKDRGNTVTPPASHSDKAVSGSHEIKAAKGNDRNTASLKRHGKKKK